MKLLIILVLVSSVGCAHGSFGHRFAKAFGENMTKEANTPQPIRPIQKITMCTTNHIGFGNYATNCN